jgi:hypothetical protein
MSKLVQPWKLLMDLPRNIQKQIQDVSIARQDGSCLKFSILQPPTNDSTNNQNVRLEESRKLSESPKTEKKSQELPESPKTEKESQESPKSLKTEDTNESGK